MEAHTINVPKIFDRGRNLVIPFFQRSYVWGEEQWERFLEDMQRVNDTKQQYFLGSIILKQEQTNSQEGDKRTVIDGQQRLTTITIFFKVLCLANGEASKFRETFRKDDEKDSIILIHNEADRKSFERVVNLTELEDLEPDRENDQVIKCYRYFKEHVSSNTHLFNRRDILYKLQFVCIDLQPGEDEQQIFDTINSLGMRLSVAELLKNHLFKEEHQQEYRKYWKSIFESPEDNKEFWDREFKVGKSSGRNALDYLLFAYLQIKSNDQSLGFSSKELNFFLRIDNLFESYKRLLQKVERNVFLEELREYATLFIAHINPNTYDVALPPPSWRGTHQRDHVRARQHHHAPLRTLRASRAAGRIPTQWAVRSARGLRHAKAFRG